MLLGTFYRHDSDALTGLHSFDSIVLHKTTSWDAWNQNIIHVNL